MASLLENLPPELLNIIIAQVVDGWTPRLPDEYSEGCMIVLGSLPDRLAEKNPIVKARRNRTSVLRLNSM